LVFIELEVELGEGSFVLGYPALSESAHAPGRAREFGVKFRGGALGHRMADRGAGGVAAGECGEYGCGARTECRQRGRFGDHDLLSRRDTGAHQVRPRELKRRLIDDVSS
jgi:hypothetical protein